MRIFIRDTFKRLTFALTMAISLVGFALPESNIEVISRRVGYLQGLLPAMSFTYRELAAISDKPRARDEVIYLTNTLVQSFSRSLREAQAGAVPRSVSNQFEPVLQALLKLRPKMQLFRGSAAEMRELLAPLIETLRRTVEDIHKELNNPHELKKDSESFRNGLSLGASMTFDFFSTQLLKGHLSFDVENNLATISEVLFDIDLRGIKIQGIELALKESQLPVDFVLRDLESFALDLNHFRQKIIEMPKSKSRRENQEIQRSINARYGALKSEYSQLFSHGINDFQHFHSLGKKLSCISIFN